MAVYTVIGAHTGLSAQQMLDVRRGASEDPKQRALAQFTRRMLETHGCVEDGHIAALRAHGYTDEQMAEVVTLIGVMTLGSYFNQLNQTELDFPRAPDL